MMSVWHGKKRGFGARLPLTHERFAHYVGSRQMTDVGNESQQDKLAKANISKRIGPNRNETNQPDRATPKPKRIKKPQTNLKKSASCQLFMFVGLGRVGAQTRPEPAGLNRSDPACLIGCPLPCLSYPVVVRALQGSKVRVELPAGIRHELRQAHVVRDGSCILELLPQPMRFGGLQSPVPPPTPRRHPMIEYPKGSPDAVPGRRSQFT